MRTLRVHWGLAAWLAVSLVGCQSDPEPRDEAIVVEERSAFPVARTFRALEQTVASQAGLSVLFAQPENGILAFEWPIAGGPNATARARTVARLSPDGGATAVWLRTSGYLPSSQPPALNLGVDVGPGWIGRADRDPAPERKILTDVEARCRAE